MATVEKTTPDTSGSLSVHRFSAEEYMQMVEAGILGPWSKVELIGGVIADMSPAGVPHNHFLIRAIEGFAPLIGKFQIAVQGTLPITISDVLDPDFMLLKFRDDGYKSHLARPEDVLLVIEAAESSLRKDQTVKQRLYAEAGIGEYWVADLQREQMIVYRQPEGASYKSVETFSKEAAITPVATPDFSLQLAKLFD